MEYKFDCHWFTGYKPCKFKRSCSGCSEYLAPEKRIAIVSLEAMGAVLRSTCLLPPLKHKYPTAHITWITYANAIPLLKDNPYIDRLLSLSHQSLALVQYLEFDLVLGVDKSLEAGSLVEHMKAKEKLGFGLNTYGAIRPLNKEASYQYDVGLDDNLKFYQNQKPETQQLTESMCLSWERDPYVLQFNETEKREIVRRRQEIVGSHKGVIGYNTGCSLLYPNKKLTIERSIELVKAWRTKFPDYCVALLGGKEDLERNRQIFDAFENDPMVVNTPTDQGLRSGMMWVDCCDLVFSGCSLGMHIAIALKKKVIAWFGVSCSQEIDLYDRGAKIQADVACSPCWKKDCSNEPMCYDRVSVDAVVQATAELFEYKLE
ncbi:MAG: glycosyltransferase family 9 protein [Bdellovibrionota bacterium]